MGRMGREVERTLCPKPKIVGPPVRIPTEKAAFAGTAATERSSKEVSPC